MAVFTINLGELLEMDFDIGLKNYPIFEEEYRENLNAKIIEHFYFREIGLETPELFKRFINRKMCEIMPYYNQLYKSELLQFNPLYNAEYFNEGEGTIKGLNSITGNVKNTGNTKVGGSTHNINHSTSNVDYSNDVVSDNDNTEVSSDTPANLLHIGDIKNNVYASNANIGNGHSHNVTRGRNNTRNDGRDDGTYNSNTDTNNNADTTGKTDTNTDTKNKSKIYGNTGVPFSDLLLKFRDTFINIDMLIIEELNHLFMGIY